MPSILSRTLIVALLLAPFAAIVPVRAAGEVTIYRCVASAGRVSLQDHPCPRDTRQDVRQMLRPQDPPPRTQQIAKNEREPARAPIEVRIVHVRDPQPLYECRSFDGQTYLSQTGIPEQRFVPLWVLGRDPFTFNDGFVNVGGPAPVPPQGSINGPIVYPLGTWVQDRCERLPQAEVCQRLSARKDELGTRIFNAQPSDRVRFERERQGLVEQMRSDCSAN